MVVIRAVVPTDSGSALSLTDDAGSAAFAGSGCGSVESASTAAALGRSGVSDAPCAAATSIAAAMMHISAMKMVSAPNVRIHRTGVFAAGAATGGVAGFFDEAAAFFTRIDFLTGIDVLLRNIGPGEQSKCPRPASCRPRINSGKRAGCGEPLPGLQFCGLARRPVL